MSGSGRVRWVAWVLLGGLVSACSSGGGSTAAIQVQFASTAANLPEDDQDAQVTVRLDLASGGSLDSAVTVEVRDAGSGTATSSADYEAVAPTTITFPAGTDDGATSTVVVTSVFDALIEGNETIVLALENANAGTTIGANGSATITIVDQTQPGALALTVDEGAGTQALAPGAVVSFGDQGIAAGPSGDVVVTLQNTGDAAVSLDAVIGGDDADDFSVAFDTSGLPATLALPSVVRELPAPLVALHEDGERGVRLVLDPQRLAALEGVTTARFVGFALPGGRTVDLDVERLPSPWSPDAVVRVNGEPSVPARELVDGLSMWRGEVAGHAGSDVYLGLSASGTRGWVRTSDDPADMLYLVAETSASMTPSGAECRLAAPDQLDPSGLAHLGDFCKGDPYPPGVEPEIPDTSQLQKAAMPAALLPANCRVAFETDYQFLANFPDVAAATTYVTELVAAVSEQYVEDINTTLEIADINFWEVSSPSQDPWDTSDAAGAPGATPDALLDEFEAMWSPLNGAPLAPAVEFDVGHFLSGATLGGGIAYVDVLCNENFAFGVSTEMTGSIDFATFTGEPDNLNWDFVVVAHEIGHNFNALHTHDYCPPLDQCLANPDCGTPQLCSRGTLMSYCHLFCEGATANIDLEFHPTISSIMRQAVEDSCLAPAGVVGGETVAFRVHFDPASPAGEKSATLEFEHDATNQPSPYQVTLEGTATSP